MSDPVALSRLQFAFTIAYHYLFPQLTMGLALLILLLKTLYLWRKDERYNTAARFWAKIFAVVFIMGVVTGSPMEFQFGTNWARWMLWILMLASPFPFIANTAGWFTTELGRQPWIIYGLLLTTQGSSALLTAGNILFTLIGFVGMYVLLGLLCVVLVVYEALHGPTAELEPMPPQTIEGLMSSDALTS